MSAASRAREKARHLEKFGILPSAEDLARVPIHRVRNAMCAPRPRLARMNEQEIKRAVGLAALLNAQIAAAGLRRLV